MKKSQSERNFAPLKNSILCGILFVAAFSLLCGCFSENMGSHTIVGEEFVFPEFTSNDGSFTIKLFHNLKGARVVTSKDSLVKIKYQNAYSNEYFGVMAFNDYMKLDVEVEPLSTTSPAEQPNTPDDTPAPLKKDETSD